jgi:hypothetical protein
MYIFVENYVMTQEEIKTDTQTAIVKTYYDAIYHTKLVYENGKVIATIYNYLDEMQVGYSDSIVFEYMGDFIEVVPVNGVASIDFTSTAPGEHIVKTANSKIRNGEVLIVV